MGVFSFDDKIISNTYPPVPILNSYLGDSGDYLMCDQFEGTALNTALQDTYIVPAAAAIVNNALELRNYSTNSHSGVQVIGKVSIPNKGKICIETDQQPSVVDHYFAGPGICLVIRGASITRDVSYGSISSTAVKIGLGPLSAWASWIRSAVYITPNTQSFSVSLLATRWYNLKAVMDTQTNMVYLNIENGMYSFSRSVGAGVFASLGSELFFEFNTSEYAKDNVERFKNFRLWSTS